MRTQRIVLALLCCFAVSTVAILALTGEPEKPLHVRITSIAKAGEAKEITVEFRRRNQAARFAEGAQVQARIGRRWQPPERFPALEHECLLARTNCESVVFTVPARTEACRFLLGYRVGPRPYCQAYFFLQNHGSLQQFPKFSRLVLKCVPQQPRLRRLECELPIPAEPHNEMTSLDAGASALLSAERPRGRTSGFWR